MMSQEIAKARWPGALAGLLLGCLGLAAAGCGSSVGSVSGVVTYKDKPLTSGRVTFYGANEAIRGADIGPDGTYQVAGVPTGPVQITVETFRPPDRNAPVQMDRSKMMPPDAEQAGAEGKVPARARAGKYQKIPDKYKDAKSSGLTMEVVAGENKKDLPLSD